MNEITIVSSTDTQAEVNAALGIEEPKATEVKEEPKPEVKETPAVEKPAKESKAANETEEERAEAEKDKGKGGWQRRIDKLTREKYELLEENRNLRAGKERLGAVPAVATEEEPKKPVVEDDPQPKKEAFTDYEEYLDARAAWRARQEFKALTEKQSKESDQAAENQRIQETFDSYNKRFEQAKSDIPDLEEKLLEAAQAGVNIPQAAIMAIYELENGPEVSYYIATNSDVAEKLNKMTTLRAVAEIGRIAYTLQNNPKEETKAEPKPKAEEPKPAKVEAPKTKAASPPPEPIAPVGGSSTNASVPDFDKMSMSEYTAWYKKNYPGVR